MSLTQRTEEQYAETAIDTTIENADLLREQLAEAVELLRKIAYDEITDETTALHLAILDKHGVLKHD